MKKQLLSIILALTMLVGLIPAATLTASAATLPEITNLHRGVLADGEAPNMVYWDAVNGVEKYEVKVTQGTTTKTKIVNDRCASWSEIFYGGFWSIIKDKTFTVEVTGGYSHGNLFVYETNTATLNVSAERQQIATTSITDYSIVRGKTYIEDLWMDGRIDPDLRYSSDSFDAWDDISGYPKFKLVDAPAWIQLWSNSQDDGWAYGDVTISFDPPADCTVGKYEFWIAVATSDTDGLLIRFKLPVGAYQGEDTQYWIQNMSIESPALVYWDIWKGVNAFDYLNATLIQGKTGTTYVGEDAEEILKYTQKVHAADEYYNFRPLVIKLQNDDGQVVGTNEVITVGRYRYHYSSETTTFRNPAAWVIESDVYYDENIKVYLDGKLQDVVVEEKSVEYSSTVKTAQWEFYGPWLYIYDEKPEINSVKVNGTAVADGGTFTANNGSVAIKTTYDSVLSDALTDYGCSVKQLSAYYLNGEKINVAMIPSVDNGNGTSTKTYSRNLNVGDELKVESWLEVRWPDGSKDRVDEHTMTIVSDAARQFITQPHYEGTGMQIGTNYVAWKLNFTPIKLIARCNLGTVTRPNIKEFELDVTKSRAALIAYSQKYTLYAYYGEGTRDFVASEAFSAEKPEDYTPAFTLQPVDSVSLGGAYTEVTWETNFVPVKLQVLKYNQGYCTGSQDLDVNATTASVKAGDEYCVIRAYYNDSDYVDSNKFTITDIAYYNAWFYVDDTVLDKVMVLEGDYVDRPADPAKEGYTFLGWYTDDGEKYNFAAPVTDDVHLTARFEKIASSVKYGDVNSDGDVKSDDALLALQKAVSKVELTDEQFGAADVNVDGTVTSSDALLILQFAVNKITEF